MISAGALLLASALSAPAIPAYATDAAAPSAYAVPLGGSLRDVFFAIHAGDWAGATARIDAMQSGSLQAAARAELYLAKGSPLVTVDQLTALIAAAPDQPQAAQLARLAEKRGAVDLPPFAPEQPLYWVGEQPRRVRLKGNAGIDPVAGQIEPLIQPLIVADQPAAAEAILVQRQAELSPAALTEYQQRIAWCYFLDGFDGDARRLADAARGGSGDWALQAAWVSGLASWRMGDFGPAADAFATVGARSTDPELMAAGDYWAARADMAFGRPERVQSRLRTAARLNETFYGLLSASALGIRNPSFAGLHDYHAPEWRGIAAKPNVQTAIALVGIGESDLAGDYIRHQAKIAPGDHYALLHLACTLNLASTQFWLAHNAPSGANVNIAARYPSPDWKPVGGWRVDRSLLLAHALQESSFRTGSVSAAGAMGVLQVRPGTAGDIARARGQAFDSAELRDPAYNMEFGQTYIESLRDDAGTGGLLPKVIAAYNAGPVPVAAWNLRRADKGDPLLYIESIPYWETRGYVPIVLRNYWIYEQEAGKQSTSRAALAQGLWPRFPGMAGASAVSLAEPDSRLALRSTE